MAQMTSESMFWDSGVRSDRETRLSLEEFNEEVQSYLIRIFEPQPSLKLASMLYGAESRTILPVQCRKTMQTLEEMNEPVQGLSKLLHETEYLPVILIALRYRLLSIVNLIEDQANRLLDLINTYRIVCMAPSQHEKRLRKEIYNSFGRLLEYISTISEQVEILNDEAMEQERKLLSLHKEC